MDHNWVICWGRTATGRSRALVVLMDCGRNARNPIKECETDNQRYMHALCIPYS